MKNKRCVYCNGEDDLECIDEMMVCIGGREDAIDFAVYIDPDENKLRTELAIFDRAVAVDIIGINYCPMCGRKLG